MTMKNPRSGTAPAPAAAAGLEVRVGLDTTRW
jgi:hypothetical protein